MHLLLDTFSTVIFHSAKTHSVSGYPCRQGGKKVPNPFASRFMSNAVKEEKERVREGVYSSSNGTKEGKKGVGGG